MKALIFLIILTYDEERNIGLSLKSVWDCVEEIINLRPLLKIPS